jgi:hypothetical protein
MTAPRGSIALRAWWLRILVIAGMFCAWGSHAAMADIDPATAQQAKALGEQLASVFESGNAQAGESAIDKDAFLDRVTNGITVSQQFSDGFRTGFKQSPFMEGMLKTAGAGASYHLLRVREVNGETRVLFRLLPANGGMNYNDWILGRNATGELKFVDVYVVATGELMSQTVRRIYLGAVVQQNLGMFDKLKGTDKDYIANLSKATELTTDIQSAKFNEVLEVYKTLPASLQQDKLFMVLRLTACDQLQAQNPQDYAAAVADYQKLFPGDPSLDLMCLDAFINAGNYDEAHKSIDRLEVFTGGDAYLEVLHGNVYFQAAGDDNIAAAKKAFQKAVDMEPTLAAPYWGLVTISLKTGDYDQTAALLNEIEQKLNLKIGNLQTIAPYADFVKSDAYKKWKAAHDAKWGTSR